MQDGDSDQFEDAPDLDGSDYSDFKYSGGGIKQTAGVLKFRDLHLERLKKYDLELFKNISDDLWLSIMHLIVNLLIIGNRCCFKRAN